LQKYEFAPDSRRIIGNQGKSMFSRTVIAGALLCAGTAACAQTITLPRTAPYAEGSHIAGNIKTECDLPNKLAAYVAEYAQEKRLDTRVADSVSPSDPGKVLVLEIEESVSRGNAFIGHQKFTRARGALYQDGQEIGNFIAQRYSMGGAFAGYKGSCSVLGRTVKAIGKDVADWLAAPSMEAHLGDQ
jgi:hypothetical protein